MTDSAPVPVSGLERGLADLWRRTVSGAPETVREALRRGTEAMVDSWLWELDNAAAHRIPDPIDYVEMRRDTFGSDLTMALSRTRDGSVPPNVLRSGPVQALEHAAADWACLLNDVYSYQKEIQFEGDVHNAVLVAQDFFDCDRDEALRIITRLMQARLAQFHHAAEIEIPALADAMRLPPATRAALEGHVQELRDWMTGIQHWHRSTGRYGEGEQQRRRVAGMGVAGVASVASAASAAGMARVGRPSWGAEVEVGVDGAVGGGF